MARHRRYRRGDLLPAYQLLRILAKTGYGRTFWSVSKHGSTPLFKGAVSEWTEAQIIFVNWCLFYDSVYEAYNRPPTEIIKDDEKIDEWIKFQSEQQEMTYQENYRTVGFQGRGEHKSAYS